MKRLILGLLSGIFFLTACGQTSTAVAPAPVIQNATTTPSQLPTDTNTSIPTATQTASITPLPTIPTFTPTFDAQTIVTVTPAPQAECPKEGNVPQVKFTSETPGYEYVDHINIKDILDYLNSGGQLAKLVIELSHTLSHYAIKDVTNDEIPDLIVVSGLAFQRVNIFWCQGGQYFVFPKDITEGESLGSDNVVFELHDLNQNGIPEILSIGDGTGLNVNVLEWNGKTFNDLTSSSTKENAWIAGGSRQNLELADLDKDEIVEIILKGLPNWWYYPGEPLRTQIDVYSWNGRTFIPSTTFSSPQYRFQAIQDGDRETFNGHYETALNLYKMVINSDKLDWWSQSKSESNKATVITGTASPDPIPDLTEYPRLATYAYYRIMLLHLVQGHAPEATTIYNTLQQKFGNDPYGRPYVEMATVFWESYQSTHKMYDGCAAAIDYAVKYPEILTPLGSDYHGAQSHIYVAADVCPFR